MHTWFPVWAAGIYILFALVWVYVSSFWVFQHLEGEGARLFETIKGWAFVLASGLFFYAVVRLALKRQQEAAKALKSSEVHYRKGRLVRRAQR